MYKKRPISLLAGKAQTSSGGHAFLADSNPYLEAREHRCRHSTLSFPVSLQMRMATGHRRTAHEQRGMNCTRNNVLQIKFLSIVFQLNLQDNGCLLQDNNIERQRQKNVLSRIWVCD